MDRHNSEIMNRYIADPENLKLMMNLLKSKEKQIAFETFHCFKVGMARVFILKFTSVLQLHLGSLWEGDSLYTSQWKCHPSKSSHFRLASSRTIVLTVIFCSIRVSFAASPVSKPD